MSNTEKSNNKNFFIENYLEDYLKLKEPQFSVLLKGKWGVGKTYFINNFIEKKSIDKNIKFININLFGLKKLEEINEKIFEQTFPKYIRIKALIVKATIKTLTGGIDLNINSQLQDLANSRESIKNRDLIFIFDNLERTQIDIQEIFGYINLLVEDYNTKVILIADEEKILSNKEKSTVYLEFKEKVIGKQFEIQHDFDAILRIFIQGLDPRNKLHGLQKFWHYLQNKEYTSTKKLLNDEETRMIIAKVYKSSNLKKP